MEDKRKEGCEYCDSPAGKKTFANQVTMPLNGRVQCIDRCISHLVAALNAGNIPTVASCCGHKKLLGLISLEDGRQLIIADSLDAALKIIGKKKGEKL